MNALQLSNFGAVEIIQNANADQRKQEALKESKLVDSVNDSTTETACVFALRGINTLLKLGESSRVEVKAPVLALAKKIDDVAKSFCAGPDEEKTRLEKLLSKHQSEQRRIQQEAESKRQAEIQRIENERRAAARAEQDRLDAIEAAEQARIKALQAEAKSKEDRIAANKAIVAEAERKERVRVAQEEAERLQRLKPVVVAVVAPVVKPAGVTTREVWKFEVTNIHALYAAFPGLVKMEPCVNSINHIIREGARELPGLRIWSETQSTVRSA